MCLATNQGVSVDYRDLGQHLASLTKQQTCTNIRQGRETSCPGSSASNIQNKTTQTKKPPNDNNKKS